LITYDKDFRESLTGKKESKIINEKERKVVTSKGLLKQIIEPRIVYFLTKLGFNSSNALIDFYEQEILAYENIINTLEQQNYIESNKRIESKINRLQNTKLELEKEKENGQEFSLLYLINEDFLAMNGVISFAFPVFSDVSTLYKNENNKNCFVQIDLLLGSENWQKQYKIHKVKSENKNALRNVLLQSIVSTLSKKSEKKFFFKLLNQFNSNDQNVLGHIKNLTENADQHDLDFYSLQKQIKDYNKNQTEENIKKSKELERSIKELEHKNFLSRYVSVDPNHGVILTTVVFEYKNGKRLVSKYKKDKLKITDNFETFIKCLFGEEEDVNLFDTLENCFNSFLRLFNSGHFSENEKQDTVEKLKEYITENDIEINDWLRINLF
jgi:hypothetical protein